MFHDGKWRIEERIKTNPEPPWETSRHSLPSTDDEVKAKNFLRFLRSEYPKREFRILKAMNW